MTGEQNVEFQSGYEGFAGLARGVSQEGDEEKGHAAKLRGGSENVHSGGAGSFNTTVASGMMANSNVIESTAGSSYDQSGRQMRFTTDAAQVESTSVQDLNPVNKESEYLSLDIRSVNR